MNYKLTIPLFMLVTGLATLQCQDSSSDLLPFIELSQVHQQWLQKTSIPELAHMLQYPPLSYWVKNPYSAISNISEVADLKRNISTYVSALAEFASVGTASKCSDDLAEVLVSLDSSWALQMIDSYGKLQSGISEGSIMWPGGFRECLSVYAPVEKPDHGGFHGRYCMASWTLKISETIPELPIGTGICIPDSCDAGVIKTIIRNILNNVPVLDKLKSYLGLHSVECKLTPQSPDGAVISFIFILFMFLLLVFMGSAVTLCIKIQKSWNSQVLIDQVLIDQAPTDQKVVKCEEVNVKISKEEAGLPEPADTSQHNTALVNEETLLPQGPEKKTFLLTDILLCFCAWTNGLKILNTSTPSGQLLSIHGIRFLSLTWVIMGHTYIAAVPVIDNTLEVLEDIDNFPFQMVMQAPFSVDSFFLLSGFLVTFLFLKEADKRRGQINWLFFYFHRIWRLTPVYLIVVGFYILVFKYLGSGPFWDQNYGDDCRHTWWWYLLYISNFIPVKHMCVGWSWYLANDMQFYVISPLFLYPLWRWPKIGISVIVALLCGSWITTAVLSYQYSLIPMFVGVTKVQNLTEYQDTMWYAFDKIYDKPFCRIGPYLIGVLLGYILFKVGSRRQFLLWHHQLIGWLLATFCSASVIFGLYHVDTDPVTGMFYNAMCRSSFAVGLAWLIFVCEVGHGGIVYKLLSWKFWIPLSRLTYCCYLVHLMLIHGYYQSSKNVFYFTQLTIVTNFFGFLTMSFLLAFITSIIFESPMLNLEKLLLKRLR